MEVEFRGSQSSQVGVRHESFGLRAVVKLSEMRKGTAVKAERNTLTLDILLADTSHDLGDIIVVTLRSSIDHVNQSVGLG
jgi:hypothetical protein